jgi:tRNA (guanine26-N2/guanine27-N2)-dimethyltransferase
MWLGQLSDKKLAKKMSDMNKCNNNSKILDMLTDELDIIGYYDLHEFCKNNNLIIPKKRELVKSILEQGLKATSTHFLDTAIKSDIKEKDLIRIIRQLS